MVNVNKMMHEAFMEAVVALSRANVFRKIVARQGGEHFEKGGKWNTSEPGVLSDMVFDQTIVIVEKQMEAAMSILMTPKDQGDEG